MSGTDVTDGQKFSVVLNHMDRICIGISTMFIFRYPQQRFKKESMMQEIAAANPNLDPEQVEVMFARKIESSGIVSDF